jgi:hypothetical protein
MKKLIVAIAAMFFIISAGAQEPVKPASMGFDTVRSSIAHGRIDTITYTSKTVDSKRRALVYTPPV